MSDGQLWRPVGIVTFLVAAFLLLSMGGAVVAMSRHVTTTSP